MSPRRATTRRRSSIGSGTARPLGPPSLRVLAVNAGSSSLKLSVVEGGQHAVDRADLESPGGEPDLEALREFVESAGALQACGHRIVHGGRRFRRSTLVDDEVMRALVDAEDLAPLHNASGVAALECVRALHPKLPAVVCFDTAFHSQLPDAAALYAVPWEWVERFGVRRYGFHGLSHGYSSLRAAEMLGRPASELRTVSCHLGAGASLAAVDRGRSVDTTMGFTPNEGLVMATRSGSLDPGALLWLIEPCGLSAAAIEEDLVRHSGLLGLSGTSADMRTLLESEARGDERAATAIAVYLHRLVAGIAAMAAAMGGLDALVFTGGIGENSAAIRSRCCERLRFLGVELDSGANDLATPDGEVGAGGAGVRVLVVRAREDLAVAREVEVVIGEAGLDSGARESGGSQPRGG